MRTSRWCALAFACVLAVPATAGDDSNLVLGFSNRSLELTRAAAGRAVFEIYADPARVDTANLLDEDELAKLRTPQEIADAVNARRERLYPEEEIIFVVTPLRPVASPGLVTANASLVRAIYWWNNTNCRTCYWRAEYDSVAAVLFTNVEAGAYLIYDKAGGGWVYRTRYNSGTMAARTTYGSKVRRGFQGNAANVASRADVVMYFFR